MGSAVTQQRENNVCGEPLTSKKKKEQLVLSRFTSDKQKKTAALDEGKDINSAKQTNKRKLLHPIKKQIQ